VLVKPKELEARSGIVNSRRAFTIIELMIVVAVVAILALTAVVYGPEIVGRRQLEQAAVSVLQDLRRTQSDAMFKRTTRQVEFTVATNSYTYQKSAASSQKVTIGGGVKLVSAAFGSAPTSANVTFDPFGTPSGGGTVVLTGPGGHSIDVTVSPVVGMISMTWY